MAKATTTKFSDITTVEQLRARIRLTGMDSKTHHIGVLSAGNKYIKIRKFTTDEREAPDQIETGIIYTAGNGKHTTVRFI
jgi:hypothetical protein